MVSQLIVYVYTDIFKPKVNINEWLCVCVCALVLSTNGLWLFVDISSRRDLVTIAREHFWAFVVLAEVFEQQNSFAPSFT